MILHHHQPYPNCRIGLLTKVEGIMEDSIIETKMYELAKLIAYKPNDITYLKKAMYCQRLHDSNDGKNRDNYTNSSLATFGDAILKYILTECLFHKYNDKAVITQKRIDFENNNILYCLCNNNGIIAYAYHDTYFYHDAPENNRVHNPVEHSSIYRSDYCCNLSRQRNGILQRLGAKLLPET